METVFFCNYQCELCSVRQNDDETLIYFSKITYNVIYLCAISTKTCKQFHALSCKVHFTFIFRGGWTRANARQLTQMQIIGKGAVNLPANLSLVANQTTNPNRVVRANFRWSTGYPFTVNTFSAMYPHFVYCITVWYSCINMYARARMFLTVDTHMMAWGFTLKLSQAPRLTSTHGEKLLCGVYHIWLYCCSCWATLAHVHSVQPHAKQQTLLREISCACIYAVL